MPTEWDDIVTVEEVQSAALDSSATVAENPSDVVESALRDAQRRIATYIGRPAIVHRHRQSIGRHEWIEDETLDPTAWRAWADHQPVVEVQSPSGLSVRHDARQLLIDEAAPLVADYHAGWKREDQELADFADGSEAPLSDLTEDPPPLPRDIRRTAILLTLFELASAEHGAGVGQVTQAVGTGGTITIDGTDRQFIERQLRRLSPYRTKRI